MCIDICICIHVYVHVCAYANVYVSMYVCMCMCMYMYTYICVYMYACVCVHAYVYMCMYIYKSIYSQYPITDYDSEDPDKRYIDATSIKKYTVPMDLSWVSKTNTCRPLPTLSTTNLTSSPN